MNESQPGRIRAIVGLSAPRAVDAQALAALENGARETTLADVCARLGFAPRVTGGQSNRIYLTKSPGNFRAPGKMFVGVGEFTRNEMAVRVLEVLAYAFNDYPARETVRGRALFEFRPGPGRPPTGLALTPAEKMRRYRARKATR